VVLAVAVILALPAVVPLMVHDDCGDLVLRSAVRNKSHYHHLDDLSDPRSERSILVRGCITKARNRTYLSLVELTPVVVGAVYFLFIRRTDRPPEDT
jgi:hypothetical protein